MGLEEVLLYTLPYEVWFQEQGVVLNFIDRYKLEFILPLLVTAYPVIALFGLNVESVDFTDGTRPLIFLLIVVIGIFLILAYFLKNRRKSALITSAVSIFLLSYGHIYTLLKPLSVGEIPVGRHRYLVPIWLGIFALIIWRVAKSRIISSKLFSSVLIVSVIALIFPLTQLITFGILKERVIDPAHSDGIVEPWIENIQTERFPDVYYIILDGYPREDVLLDEYEMDNSDFIRELDSLGFYIAGDSRSNYALTDLSLASSLNMNYLESLVYLDESENSRSPLEPFIKNSKVRNIFENLGYRIVAFETGYGYTEIEDADLYLEPGPVGFAGSQGLTGLTAFEMMILETSVGRVLLDGTIALPRFLKSTISLPYRIHRERILFTFDELEELPEVPSPKFVFAHIDSPHPPYVFGPEGELIENTSAFTLRDDLVGWTISNPKQAFVNQIEYLNSRIIPMLRNIINGSDIPPIVIVQADHGGFYISDDDRMKILNAYFLPSNIEEVLYDQISPVNTFRILFNYEFGADFEILDDVFYYSSSANPYIFTVIP